MKDSLIAIIRGKLKRSTWGLIALIAAVPTLMQLDNVKNFVTPLAAAHPKLATTIGALTMLGTLLHQPVIQAIFSQITEVDASGKVEQTTTVIEPKE